MLPREKFLASLLIHSRLTLALTLMSRKSGELLLLPPPADLNVLPLLLLEPLLMLLTLKFKPACSFSEFRLTFPPAV